MSQNTSPQRFLNLFGLTEQLTERLKRCVLFAVVPATLCYALVLRVFTLSKFEVIEVIRDPVQQTDVSSWLGFLSNLGVFMTAAAAVICLFIFSTGLSASRLKRECLFLVGLLSALLAFDDFFLIHDRYIDERLCYLAYAVCLVALLLRHSKTIWQVDAPAFLIAGGVLALSIFTDLIQEAVALTYTQTQILEEGCKFVGMSTWLYFSCRLAMTYAVPKSKPL